MARPALIIGVGGAGQYILTHLKKDLLETYGNKMPNQVKLLSFDTVRHPSALAGNDPNKNTEKGGQSRQKKAGAVELKDGIEYIHIGADLNALVTQINNGTQPHLKWINSDNVLRTLPQAALQCDDGAGAIRQLGRLCLINDIQKGAGSLVQSNIRTAFRNIAGAADVIDAANRLEIIIVGSLAGGTGSGMLVDIPLLCRTLAPAAYGGNIIVRGFIITPRAFTEGGFGGGADPMLASSFAAWRELDRWMITSEDYGGNRVQYSSIDTKLNIESKRRLYDITYMIDPMREHNPLPSGHPEVGLYPGIANVIAAILDDEAGKVYSQDVAININGTLIAHPNKPLHSTVGSSTIKEPVFYEQMKGAYTLGRDSLDVLLAPILTGGGEVASLQDNANRDITNGNSIRTIAAVDFLAQSVVVYKGDNYPNTGFEKRIADIFTRQKRLDRIYIRETAKGSLVDEKKGFKDVGADVKGQTLLPQFTIKENHRVWEDVPTSESRNKDPNSRDEKTRVENGVIQSRQTFLGEATRIEDLGGEYGVDLDIFREAHLRVFKRELRAYNEMVLNGTNVNPVIARGGKLGWLIGFHEGLLEVLNYYQEFLQDVINDRNSGDLNKSGNARASAERAWKTFENNPKKGCWVTVWDQNIHPESHRLQRAYLQAEDRVNQVRKEEILLLKIVKTVMKYIDYVQSSWSGLKEYEVYLAKGKTWEEKDTQHPNKKIKHEVKGLYKALRNELQNVESNYQYDLNQHLVTDVLPGNVPAVGATGISDLLAQLQWEVGETENSLVYKLTIAGQSPMELLAKGSEPEDEENLLNFSALAEQPFAMLLAQTPPQPLSEEIRTHPHGATSRSLANYLNKRAAPFYALQAGALGALHTPEPRRAFVRVNAGGKLQYFEDLVEGLHALDATVFFEDLTHSQDNYKLTYLRFDDCIESQDFEIWNICKDAYLAFVNNPLDERKPRDFHVFPAELHACEFEGKIASTLNRHLYTLHPKIVALLDNEQKVEMFFRALALGFIKEQVHTDGNHWIFKTPGMAEEIWLTKPDPAFGVVDDEEQTRFRLMHQFVVKGCDVRPNLYAVLDYQVDWPMLRDEINRVPADDRISRYREEISMPGKFIPSLRDYVTAKRAPYYETPAVQNRTAVAHAHLADLAETIYKIAINNKS